VPLAQIGRNGKGKSTLLRWLAARRVGGLPDELSVHYVSQEVTLTDEEENSTPIAVVLAADVERTMLLEEVAAAENDPGGVNGTEIDAKRLGMVHDRLHTIGAESAEARASTLLVNLGFSDELRCDLRHISDEVFTTHLDASFAAFSTHILGRM